MDSETLRVANVSQIRNQLQIIHDLNTRSNIITLDTNTRHTAKASDACTLIEYGMINAVKDKMTFPIQSFLKYNPSDIQKEISLPPVHVRGTKTTYQNYSTQRH
ncbi:serine hydrolase FSH [Penicillium soppii]|uniref:serine hydrolase FSH n=1 Tax=Penicillium soppii TaxID=69789 RepID=UPI002548D718|nr:serine hydrolase FSH [Penicillium soppii]KAJ5871615.1 serine hydrolase FSH [Penicillium soppii]